MRIAIDISPLNSGHKVRGVGSYVSLIKNNIEKYDKKNEYVFFDGKEIPASDVIHYPYFDPFVLTLPGSLRKKTIVTVHDLTPIVFKEHFPAGIRGKLKWVLQKKRLKKADIIIADSKSSKKDIVKIVEVPEKKVRVAYLAADNSFRKLEITRPEQSRGGNSKLEIQKKFSLPDSFLLYVGDATWNKNIPALLKAVKQTDYKLVIVGKVWESNLNNISNNPWNKDLISSLKVINNDSQFINLGFLSLEDLVRVYNLATVFVMPSIYEGFGLPVLEAMSCGCPVITTRGGSLPEVGGDAVFYSEGFGSESLQKSIEEVFNNGNLQKELSEKGLNRAKEFSVEKTINSLIQVYESLS